MEDNNNENIEPKFKITLGGVQTLENKSFNKSNNFITSFYSDLHINEIRIINSLIFIFDSYNNKYQDNQQIQEYFKNIIYEKGYFKIKYQDLLNLIRDNRNLTITDIDKHLENIRIKKLSYTKVKNENGKFYNSKIGTSFIYKYEINTPKDLFGGEVLKETYIKFYIDTELYKDIFQLNQLKKIGYTKFNINLNKLSSRLGLGLYEELTRITPLKNKKKGKVQEFDYKDSHNYSLEQLNLLFGTDFKYLSHIKPKIQTQYKKLLKLELIKDIYEFSYTKSFLNINIKRNILKEMFDSGKPIF